MWRQSETDPVTVETFFSPLLLFVRFFWCLSWASKVKQITARPFQLNVFHLGAALSAADRAEHWRSAWHLLQLSTRSQERLFFCEKLGCKKLGTTHHRHEHNCLGLFHYCYPCLASFFSDLSLESLESKSNKLKVAFLWTKKAKPNLFLIRVSVKINQPKKARDISSAKCVADSCGVCIFLYIIVISYIYYTLYNIYICTSRMHIVVYYCLLLSYLLLIFETTSQ